MFAPKSDALPPITFEVKDVRLLSSFPHSRDELWAAQVKAVRKGLFSQIFEDILFVESDKTAYVYGIEEIDGRPRGLRNDLAARQKEFISFLRNQTSRNNAALGNPTKIFLPDDLEYLREKEYLSRSELEEILFDEPVSRTVAPHWCKSNKVPIHRSSGEFVVRFDEVERVVLGMLPIGFPIADKDHDLRYSKMLLLVRRNELHSSRVTYRCMFTRLATCDINVRLTGKSHLSKSIFEKHKFKEPNGDYISTSTHKIRHYLNTLAQLGGMSQLDVALWSGRTRVSENDTYDHVSNRDVLEMVRAAVGEPNQAIGPLARLRGAQLIDRSDFAKLKVPTAHTTDLGYCIHDFSLLPCQVHQDCLNCDEHVCVKGEQDKEVRLKLLIDETRTLLLAAERAQRDQFAGTDRWVRHQKKTIERAEELLGILENPSVPHGAVISISSPTMPSQLAMAVNERQRLIRFTPNRGVPSDRRRRQS